eukprot:5200-Heterococcus_DN1.PRE.2
MLRSGQSMLRTAAHQSGITYRYLSATPLEGAKKTTQPTSKAQSEVSVRLYSFFTLSRQNELSEQRCEKFINKVALDNQTFVVNQQNKKIPRILAPVLGSMALMTAWLTYKQPSTEQQADSAA